MSKHVTRPFGERPRQGQGQLSLAKADHHRPITLQESFHSALTFNQLLLYNSASGWTLGPDVAGSLKKVLLATSMTRRLAESTRLVRYG